ncbi:MAG: putative transposase, partial [Lentisphaeria bacterium]
KKITRPMLGFKNFHAAQRILKGIELMRMLKKGQMKWQSQRGKAPAELFYVLAG